MSSLFRPNYAWNSEEYHYAVPRVLSYGLHVRRTYLWATRLAVDEQPMTEVLDDEPDLPPADCVQIIGPGSVGLYPDYHNQECSDRGGGLYAQGIGLSGQASLPKGGAL